jgi:hypothetical protein
VDAVAGNIFPSRDSYWRSSVLQPGEKKGKWGLAMDLPDTSAEEIKTNEIPVCVDSGCAGRTYFAVVSF